MESPERTRGWAVAFALLLGGVSVPGCGDPGANAGDDGGGPAFAVCHGSPEREVVDALWRDLDAHYALFDIRLPDGDWDAIGQQACDRVTAGVEGDALFDVLLAMLQSLDDGHVQLEAADLGRDEDAWVSAYPYYAELELLEGNAEDNYLDGELAWAAEDWFAWGTIGSIGYLSITSMEELSASGDEDDDVQAAAAAMDAVLADLSGTSGLIVDVRANEGGWDTVALAIASRFAGPETLAWSEQRRAGAEHDVFTAWEDTLVAASGAAAYAGPVVVLTSGGTFSAAETFVLAMRVRADVQVLGEPTSGHFSDLEDGTLPNGWAYTFSAERYRAADGEIYEARGVPVDTMVALDVGGLAAGTDVMIDAALQHLGG